MTETLIIQRRNRILNSTTLFWSLAAACLFFAAGCSEAPADKSLPINLAPTVRVVQPELRDIHRAIAQPGLIEPYEQTAIYSKVAGFVQKWYHDIGDKVKKDELLVELLVPELAEEYKQKQAIVDQQKAMVDQAQTLVKVAESNAQAAADAVAESKANVNQYEAAVKYWQGQLGRMKQVGSAVNPEVVPETQQQVDEKQAQYDAALAAVKTKESQKLSAEAQVDKSKADLAAAKAQVEVAEADARRVAAIFAYTKITAPYDGVITVRNVNTGDFVRTASGDASGREDSTSSSGRASPLLMVARTDPMMFVIGVPEIDSAYVSPGTKATLRLQALAGREFDVPVTRTSLAVQNQSRTLQAEIDLPNPHDELLPGMYAYGSIDAVRKQVRAIPTAPSPKSATACVATCWSTAKPSATKSKPASAMAPGSKWSGAAPTPPPVATPAPGKISPTPTRSSLLTSPSSSTAAPSRSIQANNRNPLAATRRPP